MCCGYLIETDELPKVIGINRVTDINQGLGIGGRNKLPFKYKSLNQLSQVRPKSSPNLFNALAVFLVACHRGKQLTPKLLIIFTVEIAKVSSDQGQNCV